MPVKYCEGKKGGHGCLVVAREAFVEAGAGRLSPSELGRVLRELLAGCDEVEEIPLCRELKSFLELDLSDYAYSLAIHDRPALLAFEESIRGWAERLAAEIRPASGTSGAD